MKKITLEIPDRDERGVSPVIGVILMVAITVILAAVIASFVLGFGDSVNQTVQAGVDVSENDDGTATVTWISEGNAAQLNVSVSGTDSDIEYTPDNNTISSVGETTTLSTENETDTMTVTVTAVGESDSKTVVTQEEVTLEKQSD